MNPDFLDMLRALSAEGAEFLLVGGYAVVAHGHVRTTKDIDFWVKPTPENAARVMAALVQFGAALHDLTLEDLTTPDLVFQVGLPPRRIDFLTTVEGVGPFCEVWQRRAVMDCGGIEIPVIGLDDLIAAKRASARHRDLDDAEALERCR